MSAAYAGPSTVLSPLATQMMDPNTEPTPAWLRGQLKGTAPRQLPNLSDWRPGDLVLLVLFAPLVGDAFTLAIETTQQAFGASAHEAKFTHVAVYLGNGEIVDARPLEDVDIRHDLAARAEHALLRVRRLSTSLGYTAALGQQIANNALAMRGRHYSLWLCAKIWVDLHYQRMAGKPAFDYSNDESASYICTVHCEIAIDKTRAAPPVRPRTTLPPLPYLILVRDIFDDVGLGWRKAA